MIVFIVFLLENFSFCSLYQLLHTFALLNLYMKPKRLAYFSHFAYRRPQPQSQSRCIDFSWILFSMPSNYHVACGQKDYKKPT